MNHTQHKFLTTAVVFVMLIIGIFTATRFNDISVSAVNISLLLVNALLLLIILGILLQLKENFIDRNKKKS